MTQSANALTADQLARVPHWRIIDGVLTRTVMFKDFSAALLFVNAVGWLAEAAAHHPDIDIRWNKVRLALTTHDANGLTILDFGLAAQIDALPAVG